MGDHDKMLQDTGHNDSTHNPNRYEWSEGWIKALKGGCCPECGRPIHHKGVRWKCSHCSLHIKGNPGLLAFILKKPEKTMTPIVGVNVCPECGAKESEFQYDPKRAEHVCRMCGLVLDGPPARNITYPFHYNIEHLL